MRVTLFLKIFFLALLYLVAISGCGDDDDSDSEPANVDADDDSSDDDDDDIDDDDDADDDFDDDDDDLNDDANDDVDDDDGPCSYEEGVRAGTINKITLIELSGLVASWQNEDVFWTHNDGNEGIIYAINSAADFLGSYPLQGIAVHDLEDIAVGPGPEVDASYLYVGDIGNNGRHRLQVQVIRAKEPDVEAQQEPVTLPITEYETLLLLYPNEVAHDAETLLIDPVNGDLFVVTKAHDDGIAIVFRAQAPLLDGQEVVLEAMTTIVFDAMSFFNLATGGDVNRAGDKIIIRTTFSAFIWDRPDDSLFYEAFNAEPCKIPLIGEVTGEAVGFDTDSASFYTTSEWLLPPLYYYAAIN